MIFFLRAALLLGVISILTFVIIRAQGLHVEAKIAGIETREISSKTPTRLQIRKPSRDVGVGIIASPLEQAGPLERIEPLAQPTSPPSIKPVEALKKPSLNRWRLVFNAVASSAGTFEINNLTFTVPDIEVLPANEKCQTSDGERWPCGMVARTTLRSFINGKALNCKLPDVPTTGSIVADCRLRGQDLSQWLVASGWARAKADGPFANDQKIAELARRGIFGAPPSGVATVKP